MFVWRVVYRRMTDREWHPVNNKMYPEKRYATLCMRHASWHAEWDDQEKVWVDDQRDMLYKIQSAKVGDWEDFGAK